MEPKSVRDIFAAAFTWVAGARSEPAEDDLVMVNCSACGSRVQAEWRLCPYCGTMRRGAERASQATSG